LFGRIATLHALSDLYAALCTPQSAMVMVTLPWGTEAMVRRELNQLMLGVARELAQAGCALSGGHTAEGAEPALGLVVNGYPAAGGVPSWAGARPDDLLILTKPIGTGVILAADMRALATGPVVDAAIRNMLISNAAASAVLAGHGAHAVTDVTGFGLLGHLLKQLRQGGLSCRLDSSAVPVLPGAAALSSAGIRSSLYPANARQGRYTDAGADLASLVNGELLADPQTSGGLLAAVAPDTAAACLGSLREAGAEHAAIIGKVTERRADEPIVLFRSLATDTAENL
jgi:selenide,water dikinase